MDLAESARSSTAEHFKNSAPFFLAKINHALNILGIAVNLTQALDPLHALGMIFAWEEFGA